MKQDWTLWTQTFVECMLVKQTPHYTCLVIKLVSHQWICEVSDNRYWSTENSMLTYKLPSHYVNFAVWCAESKMISVGPLFSDTTNSHQYVICMLTSSSTRPQHVIFTCRKCTRIKHINWSLYSSFLHAVAPCNYNSSLLVLKNRPHEQHMTIMDAPFLIVSFYCIIHSEFLLLTHNIPGMNTFLRKKNSKSKVIFKHIHKITKSDY
jgi:hypothetical protein